VCECARWGRGLARVAGERGYPQGAATKSRFIAQKKRDGAEYLATLGMTFF
jgi:hypothetical protein